MKIDDARRLLLNGGSLPELMEAIAVAANDKDAEISDLLLGLSHSECVAEQAALALYERTSRPYPRVGTPISRDAMEWRAWLSNCDSAKAGEWELARALQMEQDQMAALKQKILKIQQSEGASGRQRNDREIVRDFITKSLKGQDRLIIILFYYERLSFKEIADTLNTSEAIMIRRHAEVMERVGTTLRTAFNQANAG